MKSMKKERLIQDYIWSQERKKEKTNSDIWSQWKRKGKGKDQSKITYEVKKGKGKTKQD
jgi:hypothetical protein